MILKPKHILCCIIFLLIMFSYGAAIAQSTKVFKSNLVHIHYHDDKQLERLFELIKPKAKTNALNQLLVGGGNYNQTLGVYIDTVFKRVQKLLNMVMPKLRVNIYLFKNQPELYRYFLKVHGGPTAVQKKLGVNNQLPSFYFKKTNTIYAQVDFYSLGILAHEMGHCVTEHYFVVRPPQRVAELISQFVDREITAGRF